MDYSKDEFFDLMQAAEDDGCTHTEEMCVAKEYNFTGKKSKPVTLAGCGNTTIFEVPYVGLDKHGNEMPVQPVRVCAVDDDMGRWPRFGGDRFGDGPVAA